MPDKGKPLFPWYDGELANICFGIRALRIVRFCDFTDAIDKDKEMSPACYRCAHMLSCKKTLYTKYQLNLNIFRSNTDDSSKNRTSFFYSGSFSSSYPSFGTDRPGIRQSGSSSKSNQSKSAGF